MEKSKDIHYAVYRYIMDYDTRGEKIVKNMFMKQINLPTFESLKEFPDSAEDLFYTFYERKIIRNREKIKNLFEKDPFGIIEYVKRMINSFLKDERDRKKLNIVTLKDKKTNEPIDIDNINFDKHFDHIIFIEAKDIIPKIRDFFTEEELKTLCYLIFKDKKNKNFCLENLSQDAIYKRAERLKKKLRAFIKDHSISKESFELFLDKFLMSEFCKKLCS